MNTDEQDALSYVSIDAWQAENLRLTVFLRPNDMIIEQSWWDDLFGDSPDATSALPKMKQKREEGRFDEGKLVLMVQPERIDWLFTVDKQELNVEELPTIGPFPRSLERFSELMEKWLGLDTCPPIQRLAFGAILSLPVKDQEQGYRQISVYLPFTLDPENSSDFMYQINRPRGSSSGIAGLRINRLSKWSVATTYWLKSKLSLGLASAAHSSRTQLHSCRLELDVNTMPDFKGELTQEQLLPLYQELINLGKEIVENGDTK